MDPFLAWIETSALSTWVREDPSIFVFPAIVTLHTLGMGFLAGTSAAIDLRILGVAKRIPLAPMQKFFPVMWLALVVNVTTGVLLLIGYPTKALTNPDFYLKLALIAGGVWLVGKIRDRLDQFPKGLAIASLICWGGAITAGRLLAYTYRHLMAGR